MRTTGTKKWKSLFRVHPLFAMAIIGAVLILAIVGVATNWWARIPHDPQRPTVVPKDAVWIAEHKSGQWILCAVTEYGDKAQCSIWDYAGTLVYEGGFKTYKESLLSPNKRLDINKQLTGLPEVFIHNVFVPVIHLSDHKLLIPAEAYSEVIKDFADALR